MLSNYKNTEFQLYGYLVQMRELFKTNSIGESEIKKINQNIELIQSRKFNVAVMGEFKRGKSSLINALLGYKILPADVTPATATINRITYGSSPSMTIFYHDGTTEAADMKNISDYVTMLTEEGLKRAAQIREAVITYPTVICQNHVDIIDTPGLNDNIEMTKVTMKLLPDIDAVIMVISALAPFSEKETEFVCQLIESDNVENIVFVVTYIDQIDEDEQDKFIEYINGRIRSSISKYMGQNKGSEENLLKAKRILDNCRVLGVSSLQALKAFVTGDRALLKKSRFEAFKNELYEFLTAQQGVNMIIKTVKGIHSSIDEFNRLSSDKISRLEQEINIAEQSSAAIRKYCMEHRSKLETVFQSADSELRDSLNSILELKNIFMNSFFKAMNTAPNTGQGQITGLIADQAAKCYDMANGEVSERIKNQIFSIFTAAVNNYSKIRRCELVEPIEQLNKIQALDWKLVNCFDEDVTSRMKNFGFPKYNWQVSPIPNMQYLYSYDLMGNINNAVNVSVNTFYEYWNMYIRAARNWWIQQSLNEVSANMLILNNALRDVIEKKKGELLLLKASYEHQKNTAHAILNKSNSILSNI